MTDPSRAPSRARPRRLRLARILSASLLALLLALLLVLVGGLHERGTTPWWLELLRYLPYPVLLGAAGLALLLALPLGRWWIAAGLAVTAAIATVTMGLAHGTPEPAPGGSLRLMTYNVKAALAASRPGGIGELLAEIARHHPDVLLAQDAHGTGPDRPLDRALPGLGLVNVWHFGQYLVASRLPLRDCADRTLQAGDDTLGFVRCTLLIDGRDVTLVDVHFESPRRGLVAARRDGLDGLLDWRRNYEDRLAQAQLLALELGDGPRPLIVAGDLNAPEASPVVQTMLRIGLRDAFSSAGRGYGYTYGQAMRLGFPFLRIDHILVSPAIGIASVEVGGGVASQHQPVIAQLWLRGAGGD